jgi:hypothetical protein
VKLVLIGWLGGLTILSLPALAEDDMASRTADVARDRVVKAEADRVAGVHALAAGRRLVAEGRIEEAEPALARAVALMPTSLEAREALQSVRSALGCRPDHRAERLEALAQAQAARQDHARARVEGSLRESERLMGQARWNEALRILKEAQETLAWMPPGPSEVDRWRSVAEVLARQAERGATEEKAHRLEAQRRAAERAAAAEMETARKAVERRSEALLKEGRDALAAGRWRDAEYAAGQAAEILPGDPRPAALAALGRERRHVEAGRTLALSRVEEGANLREFSREQQVPYSREVMRHPPDWPGIRRRGQFATGGIGVQDPAWKQVLQDRLQHPVHYRFDGIPFKDAREYLEVQGRVVINMAKPAQDAVAGLDETPIQLASPEEGMSLESALNALARQVGLVWTMRDETLLFTTAEDLKETPVLVDYDLRDVVFKLKDFPGPKISLNEGGKGITLEEEEREEQGDLTSEELVEFIQGLMPQEGGKK